MLRIFVLLAAAVNTYAWYGPYQDMRKLFIGVYEGYIGVDKPEMFDVCLIEEAQDKIHDDTVKIYTDWKATKSIETVMEDL
jgi:hypothetical protein